MADPVFRLVVRPSVLLDTPVEWARELLEYGEIALLPVGALEDMSAVAHRLDLIHIKILRGEETPGAQEETVKDWAGSMPLIVIGHEFSDDLESWAQTRGPMTLLVHGGSPLPEDELRRVSRFAATLGRQSE